MGSITPRPNAHVPRGRCNSFVSILFLNRINARDRHSTLDYLQWTENGNRARERIRVGL